MTNIVTVNGKQCDLSNAFPIKIGVYKKLLRKGIDPSKENLTPLESMEFMQCVISSVNHDISESDFDELSSVEFAEISKTINTLAISTEEAIAPLEDG